MSSEQEESADHLDDPTVNSNVTENQSEDQRANCLREHAKPRRRRRGKKRKQRKKSAATCEAENPEECESELHAESEHDHHDDGDSPEWGSDDSVNCNYDGCTNIRIRPVNVPMAPLNSTQFIMDDHDDCRFYMSFETPNPYGYPSESLEREDNIIEPIGEDAAYRDIDYQYESPQDFDNSAYYDTQFELSYKNNRFEELMRLPRTDLMNRLQTLEARAKEINQEYVKENPSPILEKLQTELLELQEKNSYLKESNLKLTTVLLQNKTDCSKVVMLEDHTSPVHEHDSEDSDREVYEDCNEVIMSEVKPEPNFPNEDHRNFDENQTSDCEKGISQLEEKPDDIINLNEHSNHSIDSNEERTDLQKSGDKSESEGSKLLKSEECSLNKPVLSVEDKKPAVIKSSSNSHVMLYQPKNIVQDDIRTLNIPTSELFHINQTTCSSSVPREGGMSPSETSVN